jgi:hypothetical protein
MYMQLQIQKNWYHVFNRMSGLFLFLVCLSSIGFVIMHPLVDVAMHGSQIDIIHDSLPDVARRVRWVDPQAASTIDTIQTLITRYQTQQDIRSGNLISHARS